MLVLTMKFSRGARAELPGRRAGAGLLPLGDGAHAAVPR